MEVQSNNHDAKAGQPSAVNGPPLLFPPRSRTVATPLPFGARRHVFIDDAILSERENLQVTLNNPSAKQAILKDFEIEKSAWRPSVYDVDGVVHMAIPDGYGSQTGDTFLATSLVCGGNALLLNFHAKIDGWAKMLKPSDFRLQRTSELLASFFDECIVSACCLQPVKVFSDTREYCVGGLLGPSICY